MLTLKTEPFFYFIYTTLTWHYINVIHYICILVYCIINFILYNNNCKTLNIFNTVLAVEEMHIFIQINLQKLIQTLYKFEILSIYQYISASTKYSFFRILRDVSSWLLFSKLRDILSNQTKCYTLGSTQLKSRKGRLNLYHDKHGTTMRQSRALHN